MEMLTYFFSAPLGGYSRYEIWTPGALLEERASTYRSKEATPQGKEGGGSK